MKYIIKFEKTGVVCYTSHLDIVRLFKRSFKRAGIRLAYSQGFNPHPKMGFAQPLSLGYRSYDEYIEFETAPDYELLKGREILNALREVMPEGLFLVDIREADEVKKTLASMTEAAEYEISIPVCVSQCDGDTLWHRYMDREEITVYKKQKKKKEPVLIDIKPKIRRITFRIERDELQINALLDAGSDSNLSPELVIDTVISAFGIVCDRYAITVSRTKLHFK